MPTQSDIHRGIRTGTSKRTLYQELSKIAEVSRDSAGPIEGVVRKGLKKTAEEIHRMGAE